MRLSQILREVLDRSSQMGPARENNLHTDHPTPFQSVSFSLKGDELHTELGLFSKTQTLSFILVNPPCPCWPWEQGASLSSLVCEMGTRTLTVIAG